MSLRAITVCVLCLLSWHSASAQDRGFEPIVTAFFAQLQAGESDTAVNTLFASSPWSGEMTRDLQQVKDQLRLVGSNAGRLVGYYPIAEANVAGRYVRVEYMGAYERQSFRFSFTFYKPEEQWYVDKFGFQYDLDDYLSQRTQLEITVPDF